MIIDKALPKGFVQIQNLEVCSNNLINSFSLIGINDFPPFLIGKGYAPLIWLYIKDQKGNWQLLVEANKTFHPDIRVLKEYKSTKVMINQQIIVDSLMTDDNSCVVSELDLRPIGLNIFGDNNGLTIGGNRFTDNTVYGSKYLVGFNE
jgi:hypothetical protein